MSWILLLAVVCRVKEKTALMQGEENSVDMDVMVGSLLHHHPNLRNSKFLNLSSYLRIQLETLATC